MERCVRAANQPKTVCWYDTAHDLNDVQVLLDHADWLHQHIGIGSIRPFLARVVAK